MPRGRKKDLSISEKIAKLDLEIKELGDELKKKKADRKKLEKLKANESLQVLAAAVAESGMTVEEVLELLKK